MRNAGDANMMISRLSTPEGVSLKVGKSTLPITHSPKTTCPSQNLLRGFSFEFLVRMGPLLTGDPGVYNTLLIAQDDKGCAHAAVGPRVELANTVGLVLLKSSDSIMFLDEAPKLIIIPVWIHAKQIQSTQIQLIINGNVIESAKFRLKQRDIHVRTALENFSSASSFPEVVMNDSRRGNVYVASCDCSASQQDFNTIKIRVQGEALPVLNIPGPALIGSIGDDGNKGSIKCDGLSSQFYDALEFVQFKLDPNNNKEKALRGLPCIRYGTRLRVEYLRTTFGKAQDFMFNPELPCDTCLPESLNAQQKQYLTTQGRLGPILRIAAKRKQNVLITLDGGNWYANLLALCRNFFESVLLTGQTHIAKSRSLILQIIWSEIIQMCSGIKTIERRRTIFCQTYRARCRAHSLRV
jgi:hypothetical protein